jgi:hypothetical protein
LGWKIKIEDMFDSTTDTTTQGSTTDTTTIVDSSTTDTTTVSTDLNEPSRAAGRKTKSEELASYFEDRIRRGSL